MSRKLIPDVEKLYENKAENYMFPSCMRSAVYALGEDKEYDFLFFAAVCGDLFTQTWISPKWQYNDSYSQTCHHTEIPIRSAFDACGYNYEYVPQDEIKKDKTKYIRKIVESIDRGVPVLTFGIVGPPICSIIFGYDENGDVLIGWSQFTDEHVEEHPLALYHAENYFQKRNGLDSSDGLIFIGAKRRTPNKAEIIRESLFKIPHFIRMHEEKMPDFTLDDNVPKDRQIVFGRQAFDAWADSLSDDRAFADENNALDSPLDTYGSCIVQIGTNMHYMQQYLNTALELCPDMSAMIKKLEEAYQRVRNAMQKVIDYQGGYFFDADRTALLRRGFRERLAELIRELGVCYDDVAETVKQI